MRLKDYTHLGRLLDPRRYPTHRVAIGIAGAATVTAFLVERSDVWGALSVGLSTFAAWALSRELDPDRPASATVAAVLAGGAVILIGVPSPGPLFAALMTARILLRSTGLPPKPVDLAGVTGLGVVVAGTPWGWAAGILLAFAMVRDASLQGDPPANAGLWGLACAVGVTVRVLLSGTLGSWPPPDAVELVVFVVGVAAALAAIRPVDLLSLGDWTRVPLQPRRLQEATGFVAASGIVAALAAGGPAIAALSPLWLSLASVAIFRLRPAR